MNIHEYQAKELLKGYGVTVLDGYVAWTPDEAAVAAGKLPGPIYVVKSQIHAGGRGAGHFVDDAAGKGGVRIARSVDEVKAAAEAMIGHTLVTKQTGPHGRVVRRVYVEAGCDIARELYLSLLVDRVTGRVTLVASADGGMEIEEVAANHPEKILRLGVDPAAGICGFHARRLAFGLGLSGKQISAFRQVRPGAVCRIHRPRLPYHRDQSAGGQQRRRRGCAGCQDQLRRQRACSATRSSPSCATRRRRTRRNWKPPSTS